MNFTRLTIAAAAISLAIPVASAQTTSTIHQRKDMQQQRIGQGVQNGSLTAGEAARIERQRTRVNKEVKDMRQDNGGKLTPQDRRIANRQQNRLSHEIYNQKHDAQVQHAANNEVNARERAQQQRIGQGIKNGSLTSAEAARMEHKQAAVNREVQGMRRANGGALTPGERRAVNRQQNRTSRQIYRQKHDGQVRH